MLYLLGVLLIQSAVAAPGICQSGHSGQIQIVVLEHTQTMAEPSPNALFRKHVNKGSVHLPDGNNCTLISTPEGLWIAFRPNRGEPETRRQTHYLPLSKVKLLLDGKPVNTEALAPPPVQSGVSAMPANR